MLAYRAWLYSLPSVDALGSSGLALRAQKKFHTQKQTTITPHLQAEHSPACRGNYPGEQIEHAFYSHRLCNWETPKRETVRWSIANHRRAIKVAEKVSAENHFDTLKPRAGKTEFIVNDKGHLLQREGTVKLNNSAFNHQPEVYDKTFARWPQNNPAIPAYECATMGYKGIKTNYLPSNTVTLKAVESPQQTRLDGRVAGRYTGEYNYNFM